MPVNINIVISDKAHETLLEIKDRLKLRNNAEAIERALEITIKNLSEEA